MEVSIRVGAECDRFHLTEATKIKRNVQPSYFKDEFVSPLPFLPASLPHPSSSAMHLRLPPPPPSPEVGYTCAGLGAEIM